MTQAAATLERALGTPSPRLSLQSWEREIIQTAAYFTAVLIEGRARRERYEFRTLAEAATKARTMRGKYGQRALVYAVNCAGRFVQIPESGWPAEGLNSSDAGGWNGEPTS